jgi:hypothetical protein
MALVLGPLHAAAEAPDPPAGPLSSAPSAPVTPAVGEASPPPAPGAGEMGAGAAPAPASGAPEGGTLPAPVPPTPPSVPAAPQPEIVTPAALAQSQAAAAEAARQVAHVPPTEVDQVWLTPGLGILERVRRTRAVARELGVGGFDAAARALLADDDTGAPLLRAQSAVDLAPTLPLAWAALAKARWRQESDAAGAARALLSALARLDTHLEASLWWRATALHGLALALFFGALAYLALATLLVAPRAAHDLGDRVVPGAPEFARMLLLGALVLLPAALGEGLAGVGLGLFGVAFACGRGRARFAHLAAAAVLWLALQPVLGQAGAAMAGLGADPVVAAVWAVETEAASGGELARLGRAADHDPIAERALAVHARRLGNLAEADERYARLLAEGTADGVVENNAGNVRLALGDIAGATALYEHAAGREASAAFLFNLSRAQGAAIRPDLQESTLIRAQSIDAEMVGELTDLQGGSRLGVVDLPIPVRLLRERLASSGAGEGVAAELRTELAPGRLGRGPLHLPIAFGAIAILAGLFAGRGEHTHWCPSCGARRCPRCDGSTGERSLCEACTRLLKRPETTDPSLRAARMAELRSRQKWRERGARVVGALVPGAAGLLARRPLCGLLGAIALCGATVAAGVGRDVVPDPLAVGAIGRLVFSIAAALLLLTHAGVSKWAFSHRRD